MSTLYDLVRGDVFLEDGVQRQVLWVQSKCIYGAPDTRSIVCNDGLNIWGPKYNLQKIKVKIISKDPNFGEFRSYLDLPEENIK